MCGSELCTENKRFKVPKESWGAVYCFHEPEEAFDSVERKDSFDVLNIWSGRASIQTFIYLFLTLFPLYTLLSSSP